MPSGQQPRSQFSCVPFSVGGRHSSCVLCATLCLAIVPRYAVLWFHAMPCYGFMLSHAVAAGAADNGDVNGGAGAIRGATEGDNDSVPQQPSSPSAQLPQHKEAPQQALPPRPSPFAPPAGTTTRIGQLHLSNHLLELICSGVNAGMPGCYIALELSPDVAVSGCVGMCRKGQCAMLTTMLSSAHSYLFNQAWPPCICSSA